MIPVSIVLLRDSTLERSKTPLLPEQRTGRD